MSFSELLTWSKREFSHLPWRKDRTLYKTLVSEIMLQQTTVGTVKNYFDRFLKRFPTLHSLAKASEEEVIIAWKGLGYYRRARNLKKIAQEIISKHGGSIPKDSDILMNISGIGPYTANALLSIGMDKKALAVDANLERVIARIFALKEHKGLKLQKKILDLFEKNKIFNHQISFRELNEALMDLGRTFCQAKKTACEICPLSDECLSYHNGNPLDFPYEKSPDKKVVGHDVSLLRIIVTKKEDILVYKKAQNEWLSGQYEMPTFIISSSDDELRQYPKAPIDVRGDLPPFRTAITKYKIFNYIHEMSQKEFEKISFPADLEWRSPISVDSNLSTATLKALEWISRTKRKKNRDQV